MAAGLSGPLRHRYGGLRDFLLGVRFVDGEGKVVRGGGKVVKNAAGFPFHRLMVGALGAFGVMVELSFKVFPRPRTTRTLRVRREGLKEALADLERLRLLPLDLLALDFIPPPPWSFASEGLKEAWRPASSASKTSSGRGRFWRRTRPTGRRCGTSAFWREAPSGSRFPPSPTSSPPRALPLGPRRYLDGGEVLYAGTTEEGLKALREAGLPHLVLRGRKRPSSPSPKGPSSPGSRRPWTPKAAFP